MTSRASCIRSRAWTSSAASRRAGRPPRRRRPSGRRRSGRSGRRLRTVAARADVETPVARPDGTFGSVTLPRIVGYTPARVRLPERAACASWSPSCTEPSDTSASPVGGHRERHHPDPVELVLPFAGFLIGQGTAIEPITGQPWNFWLVVLAGTIGATVGALIAYAIGYCGGRPILERWGRYLGVSGRRSRPARRLLRHTASGQLLRPDDPGHPFARVVRRRRRPHASCGSPCSRSSGRCRSRRAASFAGVQLGANWETIGGVLKRFEYAILLCCRDRPVLGLVPDHQARQAAGSPTAELAPPGARSSEAAGRQLAATAAGRTRS